MKKTILALCAITVLSGSAAQAQSTGITPPASSTGPSSTLQPKDPVNADIVNPIEDANTHDRVLNDMNTDVDVSNTGTEPDPLDPTLDPLDGRNRLEPTTPSQVTPISPSNPEDPFRNSNSTDPLRNSNLQNNSSTIRDNISTSPARNDVSNTERTSSVDYKPIGIYDTDGDGQLDTNDMLRGPVYPSSTDNQPQP